MDVREFVKKLVSEGVKQVDIAKRSNVSQATIYKLLYTETKPTMDTIMKIAKGYGFSYEKFTAAETGPEYLAPREVLSDKEKEMLVMFRQLDERRQSRIIETLEDMTLAFRESHGRDNAGTDSKESNSKQRSNG